MPVRVHDFRADLVGTVRDQAAPRLVNGVRSAQPIRRVQLQGELGPLTSHKVRVVAILNHPTLKTDSQSFDR